MSVVQVIQSVASSLTDCSLPYEIVNVEATLRDALREAGNPLLKSTELAEQWCSRLIDEIEERLEEWDKLGVPRPLIPSGIPSTLLTFRHPRYQSEVESPRLSMDFTEVLEFLLTLSPREFLLVPACLLHLAGCDPIIITDGPNDGGVDCIGQVKVGPTRSLCIFAQSKTSKSTIKVDTLRLDFDKFRTLQKTLLFSDYLAAIENDFSADGRALCYAFFGGAEFNEPARRYAREEALLLRSSRQAAFWLSHAFGISNLRNLSTGIGNTLVRDFSRNLAPIIAKYRTDYLLT
jgi:hypothetical protein